MKSLTINNLPLNEKLDRKSMACERGGYVNRNYDIQDGPVGGSGINSTPTALPGAFSVDPFLNFYRN